MEIKENKYFNREHIFFYIHNMPFGKYNTVDILQEATKLHYSILYRDRVPRTIVYKIMKNINFYCCSKLMILISSKNRNLSKRECKNMIKKLVKENYKRAVEKHPYFVTYYWQLFNLVIEEVGEYCKAKSDKEGVDRIIDEVVDIMTLAVRTIDNINRLEI